MIYLEQWDEFNREGNNVKNMAPNFRCLQTEIISTGYHLMQVAEGISKWVAKLHTRR